ncbi:MAG: 16S rRNA (guanine(527)-N(7))-methyltransferase RsmG [Candidatus Acidiferrales bacterium]
MAAALSNSEIAAELAACDVAFPPPALEQLSIYLELLLRWNRKINLTGLREPRVIVRRLFGESLYLTKLIELKGWLVDVGSGAGFPGLVLKLAAPELRVTLVEPRQRKSAFLKEAIRECGLSLTYVVNEQFEPWARRRSSQRADIITTRAVSLRDELLASIAGFLAPSGTAAFFTSVGIAEKLQSRMTILAWKGSSKIPRTDEAVILLANRLQL